MSSKTKFEQICRDILSVKIQGARNIAKAALEAYYMFPSEQTKKKLVSLRATEPMLQNVLEKTKTLSKEEILEHFEEAQEAINKNVFRLIKNNSVIFTHCHSSTVVKALVFSYKKGKHFEVYNTETRPLFQGRKTSSELRKAEIKVTQFVDSAARIAMTNQQQSKKGNKKVSAFILGADALLKNGIINKVGSGMFSEIAKDNKIPVVIVSDSWKFSKKPQEFEQRNFREVWEKSPKDVKIRNPAFEFVEKKFISEIVTELGIMKYEMFLKKVKFNHEKHRKFI